MTSAPKVDKDKVRSWRNAEPPVEIGVFPTVPRKNTDGLVETGPDSSSVPLTQPSQDGSMYTGSVAAIERGADMAGPGEDAYRSRAQHTAELEIPDDDTDDENGQDKGQQPDDDERR